MSDLAAPPSIDPIQQRAFENWLDETHGFIQILDGMYLPSEILLRVDPDAYRAELLTFQTGGPTARAGVAPAAPSAQEPIGQIVRDRFPLPVAHCFYRFERGARYATQQLTFLRDTWEAVIFLLYALVVGEFRAAGGSLATTKISVKQLFSDRINDKLSVIRQMLELGAAQQLDLACGRIVGPDTLQHMQDLNDVRNDFSHNSTMSDKQVRAIVNRYEQPVLALLHEVTAMQDVRLLRYVGSMGLYYRIQHQSFTGHNISQSFGELTLDATRMNEYAPYLDESKVIAYANGRLFSLAPFVHFVDDATGQWTKLCFLKQRGTNERRGKLIFEVLGDAVPRDEDDLLFQTELDQLAALAPPPPARGNNTP